MDAKRFREIIENPPDGDLGMKCDEAGNILTAGGETFELTDHQAGILFDGGLMLMQRMRLARNAA